ncbi:MAG: tetratricopeptide repeat protein [Acidobacteriota bacterium]|jgi:tetratricopeptide (TPR) repeat protein
MKSRERTRKVKAGGSIEDQITQLDSRAEQLFARGHFSEAGKYYSRALSLAKQPNVKAYFAGHVGICHFNAGNDKIALQDLLKSARLFDPAKPEFMPDMCGFVHFHLGSLLEYNGKITKSLEARRICEKYVDAQEKDTQWMLYAGISRNYELLGRHDEAIKYSQRAIQVLSDNDPGLAYLYESMGDNYMGLKQYHEAIKYFSRVLELDPNFERRDDVHLKVASCYHQLTNDQMALETYEKMLDLKQLTNKRENLTWLYVRIAQCQFRLERFEKSLLVTLEALRRRPGNKLEKAEVRSYLTNNYCELGRYKEAVAEGEKVVTIARRFPDDNLFYFRMALSYFKLGDKRNFSRYRALCRKRFRGDSWIAYLDKLT